jgi:hypothetical protein
MNERLATTDDLVGIAVFLGAAGSWALFIATVVAFYTVACIAVIVMAPFMALDWLFGNV